MRHTGSIGPDLRRAALGALLLPFVLLSMLAAGTMPVRALTGEVDLVICVGDALVTISVSADEAPPGEAPANHPTCPWDEAARPALMQPGIVSGTVPARLRPVTFPGSNAVADVRRRVGPITNRGPPRTV